MLEMGEERISIFEWDKNVLDKTPKAVNKLQNRKQACINLQSFFTAKEATNMDKTMYTWAKMSAAIFWLGG